MKRAFITIGREFGSGGHKIGQLIAARLGITYYDNELLLLAARKGGLEHRRLEKYDEKKENPLLFERNYEGNEHAPKGVSMEETLFNLQHKVILDIAERENAVFIGRCADFILKNHDYPTLSVFISAPLDMRIERTSVLEELSEKEVAAITRKKDKRRKKFYESHTKKTWGTPESYDLFYNVADYGSLNEIADDIISHYEDLLVSD